jgi:hypothetical protein
MVLTPGMRKVVAQPATRLTPTSHNSARLLAAAVGVLALAVTGLACLVQIKQPKASPAPAADEINRAIKEWEGRWTALIGQRPAVDVAKWNAVEKDLGDLARKYGLHLEDRRQRPPSATPSKPAACKARDDHPGYDCYWFPGANGTCHYVCLPIVRPGQT